MKIQDILSKILFGGLGIFTTIVLNTGVDSLKDLSHSVNELNVKIGVVVERTDSLQKEVQDHSERLRVIEIKKR